MNKADFLKQYHSKEWYETSKRIKARDHNTCQMCGRNDVPLSVHHLYYEEDGSIFVSDDAMITLCEECHKHTHNFKEHLNLEYIDLQRDFTPLEMVLILSEVKRKYSTYGCHPLESTINPEEIPDFHNEYKTYLTNIRNWRKKVRYKDVIDEYIDFYYFKLVRGYDTKIVEDKFKEEFGFPISEYIDKHKEECKKVKEEREKYFERTKDGLAPF